MNADGGAPVPSTARLWAAFLIGTFIALPFTLALALGISLSHDEHQHLAAGVLFAKDGLLPYRDFPYFHVPYLVYAYGLLFQFTDQFFLASRFFSAACAALTGGAVFAIAWRLFPARSFPQRAAIALSALVLMLSAPVFFNTAGHSWNQEPSTLLAFLSFLCLPIAHQPPKPALRLLASGLLLGLAIGMRVTFAPLVLPFAVMLWLAGTPVKERIRTVLIFGAAIALALLPVVWACFAGLDGFVFGNIQFPKVNIEYRFATGEPRTMTLLTKLRFLFKEVMRPNGILFFGFIVMGLMAAYRARTTHRALPRLFVFFLLILPFLLLGSLAPSPSMDHYYYPFAPFILAGLLTLFADIPSGAPKSRWTWGMATASVIASAAFGAASYDEITHLFSPQQWSSKQMRLEAAELRRLVPEGKVLTLAPTLPLEAGLKIYPEFATGPFAWRVAPFVQKELRAASHIIGPEELEARLAKDPPAALLLGYDKRWEGPLKNYAKAHRYRRISFLEDRQLWLAP